MIDVSAMKDVAIDPEACAPRGLTRDELDAATQAHGLATTGRLVSSTASPASRSAVGSAG